MYWVYILHSKELDRYDIGQTDNLPSRLAAHRSGKSVYTSRTTDWILVFAQEITDRTTALELERKIKQAKSRKSILRYIANPRNKAALFFNNGE